MRYGNQSYSEILDMYPEEIEAFNNELACFLRAEGGDADDDNSGLED